MRVLFSTSHVGAKHVTLILPLFYVPLKPPLSGLPVLLLGRDPALLKHHGADIAQGRVQYFVVVEIDPVHHLVHGLAPSGKPSSVQLADLQAGPQTRYGVRFSGARSNIYERKYQRKPQMAPTAIAHL